tara:strand:- start:142 stop:351 length:210 start_codon:yes stop_codon:yes gene_type:complete
MDKSYQQYLIDLYEKNRSIAKINNYEKYISGKSLLNTRGNMKVNNTETILNIMKELNKINHDNYLKDII